MGEGGALTPKRRVFVREYLVDLNGARAYRAAGYKGSDRVCEVEASQLLRIPEVAAAVQDAMDARAKAVGIDAERVIKEIICMALYDPADLVEVVDPDTGETRPVEKSADIKLLPEHVRRAIIGFGWDRNGNFTLKLSPKTPSLDQLGKHLKLFDRAGEEPPAADAKPVDPVMLVSRTLALISAAGMTEEQALALLARLEAGK